MKKIILLYLTHVFITYSFASEQIKIRSPVMEDCAQILELDYKVSFEFFKPLYQNYYNSFEFGQNPDKFLDLELEEDAKSFPIYIQYKSPKILRVAYAINIIVGFILFHKDNDHIHLDLLLIDKDYR